MKKENVTPDLALQGIERQPLKIFTERAYLDYSMYVILDRALPHIADGLKPVQRRIIYAMSELGLKATAKYKKSARTVGDVLGKFHPHGDSACYEAMVLMSQNFSYRYPLVDGQGNWGSMDDPKSFAAMRYTEARLSSYADILLSELEQGTVSWVPNFDGTLEEPALLSARLPNVLLNGATGIAVGMATDIPPHNMREVVAACVQLLDTPDATLSDLCQHIKGPDFPTGAEIVTSPEEMIEVYRKGNGSFRMRAVYQQEDEEIIITTLPHQVSGSKILEQIAGQMQAKKLPMVVDLRDESDHENPTRLVIMLRSNRVDSDAVMAHLFATTDLERSYRVNFNVIGMDNRPQVKDLLSLLKEWLVYRTNAVRNRLTHRLNKVESRLHILDGLLIAFLNIDEVIAIIRHEDQPKILLMQRFNLTDLQAESILELKLRHLARLEEMNIRSEQNELAAERNQLQTLLDSPVQLKKLIRSELLADAQKYGDDRRSPIVQRSEAQAMAMTEILPSEPMTVLLSQKGWIRAAKGYDIDGAKLSYKAGDGLLAAVNGRSHQMAIFLDSTGRSYALSIHDLPSARGQGEPLSSHVTPPSGADFVALLVDEKQFYLLASDAGYGFVINSEEMVSKNRAGKAILRIPDGAHILKPQRITALETDCVALVTNEGRLLIFPVSNLPRLAKGKGNKMIAIAADKVAKREEYVIDFAILNQTDLLILKSGKRSLNLKPAEWQHYVGERGRRGHKLPRGFQKVENIERMDEK